MNGKNTSTIVEVNTYFISVFEQAFYKINRRIVISH